MHFDTSPRVLAALNERMRTDPRVIRWTMLKLGERLEDVVRDPAISVSSDKSLYTFMYSNIDRAADAPPEAATNDAYSGIFSQTGQVQVTDPYSYITSSFYPRRR